MMHPVCKVWASFGQKLRLEFGSLVRVRAEYCWLKFFIVRSCQVPPLGVVPNSVERLI
jgi:hypothetical protein